MTAQELLDIVKEREAEIRAVTLEARELKEEAEFLYNEIEPLQDRIVHLQENNDALSKDNDNLAEKYADELERRHDSESNENLFLEEISRLKSLVKTLQRSEINLQAENAYLSWRLIKSREARDFLKSISTGHSELFFAGKLNYNQDF